MGRSLASGTAIEAAGQRAGFASSRSVFAAAAQGDPQARQIINLALRATATATWTILHTFMPQRRILGGGIIDEHFDLFAAVVRAQIAKATLTPTSQITVAKAVLGNDAGMVGAAMLPYQQFVTPS